MQQINEDFFLRGKCFMILKMRRGDEWEKGFMKQKAYYFTLPSTMFVMNNNKWK